ALASGLTPGYHQVRISLSGFQDWVGSVNVQSDVTTKVSQTLSVGPTQTSIPGTGSISVNSNPAGADVYLDNGYVGISPLTIPSVTAGSHVILLTHPGYANWQATVDVQQGATASVDATLFPAPTGAPTKAPLPASVAVLSLGLVAVAFLVRKP
ncbi:MAG: PEGA domain-containing protein, partial [Methanolinea sp.]